MGVLKTKTTADLLSLARSSDPRVSAEAAGELVFRYKNLIYAQALATCGRRLELADDVFQETFIRVFAWLKKNRRQPLHSFARLLHVFSRRAALDLLRKEKLTEPATEVADEADFELVLYVRELLENIDPRSAEILRLSYLDGRSAKEVADLLGLTAGNVRIIRYRALEAIRAKQAIDDYADELEAL